MIQNTDNVCITSNNLTENHVSTSITALEDGSHVGFERVKFLFRSTVNRKRSFPNWLQSQCIVSRKEIHKTFLNCHLFVLTKHPDAFESSEQRSLTEQRKKPSDSFQVDLVASESLKSAEAPASHSSLLKSFLQWTHSTPQILSPSCLL